MAIESMTQLIRLTSNRSLAVITLCDVWIDLLVVPGRIEHAGGVGGSNSSLSTRRMKRVDEAGLPCPSLPTSTNYLPYGTLLNVLTRFQLSAKSLYEWGSFIRTDTPFTSSFFTGPRIVSFCMAVLAMERHISPCLVENLAYG